MPVGIVIRDTREAFNEVISGVMCYILYPKYKSVNIIRFILCLLFKFEIFMAKQQLIIVAPFQ